MLQISTNSYFFLFTVQHVVNVDTASEMKSQNLLCASPVGLFFFSFCFSSLSSALGTTEIMTQTLYIIPPCIKWVQQIDISTTHMEKYQENVCSTVEICNMDHLYMIMPD